MIVNNKSPVSNSCRHANPLLARPLSDHPPQKPKPMPSNAPTQPTSVAFARKMRIICRDFSPMARRMPISSVRWRAFARASRKIVTAEPTRTNGTITAANPACCCSNSWRTFSSRSNVACPDSFSWSRADAAASLALDRASARARACEYFSITCVPGRIASISARTAEMRSPAHSHSRARIALIRFCMPRTSWACRRLIQTVTSSLEPRAGCVAEIVNSCF